MRMKRILGTAFILMITLHVWEAQGQPLTEIQFEKMDHNFGRIREEAGAANFTFKFTNTGKTPLILQGVEPSCGCTTPEWSQEPVLPGKTGLIKVSYNPDQRPGAFTKSITVTANIPRMVRVLTISGEVIPRPLLITDLYPVDFGKLRLSSGELSFVRIKDNELKTDTIRIYNPGKFPVSVGFKIIPPHITLKTIPTILPAESKGLLIITFNATKKGEYGFVSNRIYLSFNGEDKFDDAIKVSGTVEEDFSKLSATELANAPRIEFNSRIFDFKEISAGQSVDYKFYISNKGKSKLIIRSVTASCGCTTGKPLTNTVLPGGTTELKVTFDSYGKTGMQNKIITVISNDPEHSTTLLRVIGNVN